MAQRQAQFFPRRLSVYVPNLKYASEVMYGGEGIVNLQDEGYPIVALDADGILSAQSIASAVDTTTFAATYEDDAMAKYGRNVTVVASGASTSTIVVYGLDYLGQPMLESFTANGTTPVLGKKAFKTVTRVTSTATASVTINVGWGNALGLPFKATKLEAEFLTNNYTNDIAAAAGTFVAGVNDVQTATTGDPRGTYTPNASNLPDGARTFKLAAYHDGDNLHGNAHYAG